MREELGVHERLEVHELMMFKSLCLTKASVMKGLVTDERLKTLMQQDTEMHMRHLDDLRSHLS